MFYYESKVDLGIENMECLFGDEKECILFEESMRFNMVKVGFYKNGVRWCWKER